MLRFAYLSRNEGFILFCTECGQQQIEGAKFCANCGTKIPKTDSSQKANAGPNWGEVKNLIEEHLMSNLEQWEKAYQVSPGFLDAEEDETWQALEKAGEKLIWSSCDLDGFESLDLDHIVKGLEILWTGSKWVATFDEESDYFKLAAKPWKKEFETEAPYWIATVCLACDNNSEVVSDCSICASTGEWKFEL
jgi:hypothetical protein